MSYCDHLPSVVCHPSVLLSSVTPLNDFFSEIPRPFSFKFHTEPSVNGGLKVCSNGQGPLSKMGDMPVYGKNT